MIDEKCTPSSLLHYEQVPPIARTQLEESYAFRTKHDWRQATRCALGAREFCKDADARVGVAVAQIHLADCYREIGELGIGLEQCEEAYQTLQRQSALAQRHNTAVAIYALGILRELQLFSDDNRVLSLYQKASEQFKTAQEYWATRNAKSLINACKRACQCIQDLQARIVKRRSSLHSDQACFNVCQCDSDRVPFARQSLGYIVDDDRVQVNGTGYRLHSGALPRKNNGSEADYDGYFYFALPVLENQWAFPETQADDYVFIRQQWFVGREGENILWSPGIVWQPGSGWVPVNFKRGGDGRIWFHYSPYIIGGPNPTPDDPDSKLKGFIVALLRPE